MNPSLELLARDVGLLEADKEPMRLAFGYACTQRIRHLLEQEKVLDCLDALGKYVEGRLSTEELSQVRVEANRLANQHRGSKSFDGCGHAAVSASYAVANAVNGNVLQAADYAAYASVYYDGGYAAVAQREAFEPEFEWQVSTLRALCIKAGLTIFH